MQSLGLEIKVLVLILVLKKVLITSLLNRYKSNTLGHFIFR